MASYMSEDKGQFYFSCHDPFMDVFIIPPILTVHAVEKRQWVEHEAAPRIVLQINEENFITFTTE